MINKIVRTSLFAVAVAALCSLAQASDFRSSTVTIPFPFQVSTGAPETCDSRAARVPLRFVPKM